IYSDCFFQAEDGIRDRNVTGVQTCALPILGKSRYAVFFSIFRKVIIVIPLILILPTVFHLGTDGILMAEPVSNFIGGAACFGTKIGRASCRERVECSGVRGRCERRTIEQ